MNALRQRTVTMLDRALDWCVDNWRAMVVLLPAGTFVIFALTLFFGLRVSEALSIARALVVLEIVLAAAVAIMNFKYRRQLNQWLDAADALEAKLSKDDVFSDWDDFVADAAVDPEVERIRQHCLRLPQEYPPAESREYCNAQGVEVMEGYVRRLRVGLATRVLESWGAMWQAWRAGRKQSGQSAPAPGDVTAPAVTDDEETSRAA